MSVKPILILLLAATLACRTKAPGPVPIEASDMCALCKMAISEKRYAVEIVDRDGNLLKFDNPICMREHVTGRNMRDQVAAWFVADYETGTWTDARQAHYVKSQEIPSPMNSGLAAFQDPAKAGAFAAAHHGRVITFDDLWTQ